MSIPENTVPESPLDSRSVAPAALSPTRPFYWSLRRELWENRSIYAAPLIAAALFLFGFLISLVRLPARVRAAELLGPARLVELIEKPYDWIALLIMGTTFIVGLFYCLDALQSERRDRSILFWKSLPVSDLTTVLAKAIIPIVVLPLLSFAITVATQGIMLLLSTAVFLGSGLDVAMLWSHVSLFRMSLMLFYHLLGVHGLYYAPFFGWLLLVSGWARRATFLWAALPLVAIGVVEKIAFNTSYWAKMMGSRLEGGPQGVAFPMPGMAAGHPMAHLNPLVFLSSPGLWIGLLVTAACLAAAVRLRRYRTPI